MPARIAPSPKKKIARVSPHKAGRGRPTTYNPKYANVVFKLLCLNKHMTEKDIAEVLCTNEQTFNDWKKLYPELTESIRKGKEEADSHVAHSLYHRACGYSHEAVKIFCSKDGDVTQVPYVEHYPPDTQAASLWLRNRRPDLWRERKEITGADGEPVKVAVIQRIIVDPVHDDEQPRLANGSGNGAMH